jgi:hypothetical protein
MTDVLSRARAYVAQMPEAIADQHGHDATFKVALALVHGFGLPEQDALPIMEEYSAKCQPPWSRKELEHKLSSAAQHTRSNKPRGHLRRAYRPAPEDSGPPPARPRKKISLWTGATQVSGPPEKETPAPATPAPEPATKPVLEPEEPALESCDFRARQALWIASQLKAFFAQRRIPRLGDGRPDMEEAKRLAVFLRIADLELNKGPGSQGVRCGSSSCVPRVGQAASRRPFP